MIALQDGEKSPGGFFTMLGIGFLYEYNARTMTLNISRAGEKTPLLNMGFDAELSKDPARYIRLLDKTTQIKALKFSNNASINLAEILDDMKLPGILAASAQIAFYAYALWLEDFEKFQEMFVRHTSLKGIEIKKSAGYAPKTSFYVVTAETRRNSKVSARSSTLHAALSFLSDKFMQDIIAKEFGSSSDAWLNSLLHISSILSNLSFVLNEGFDPARKMDDQSMTFCPLNELTEKTKLIQ